jgi:hypothetical protein
VDGIAAFVGLQVADHVPMKVGGAERNFGFGFLDAIFAKESDTKRGGGLDGFGRLTFADRLERDGIRGASGAAAGIVDALADVLQIRRQIHGDI